MCLCRQEPRTSPRPPNAGVGMAAGQWRASPSCCRLTVQLTKKRCKYNLLVVSCSSESPPVFRPDAAQRACRVRWHICTMRAHHAAVLPLRPKKNTTPVFFPAAMMQHVALVAAAPTARTAL